MKARKIEHLPTQFAEAEIQKGPTILAERREDLHRHESGIQVKEKSEDEQREEYYDALQMQGAVVSSIINLLAERETTPTEKELTKIISSALRDAGGMLQKPSLIEHMPEFEAEIVNARRKDADADAEIEHLWDDVEDIDPMMDVIRNTGKAISNILEEMDTIEYSTVDYQDEDKKIEHRRSLLLDRLAGNPSTEAEYEHYQETNAVVMAKQAVDQGLSAVHHFVTLGSPSLLRVIRKDTIESIENELPNGEFVQANKPMLLRAAQYQKSLMELPGDLLEQGIVHTVEIEDADNDNAYEMQGMSEVQIQKTDSNAASHLYEGESDEDRPFYPTYRNKEIGGAEFGLQEAFDLVKAADKTQTERSLDPLYEPLRKMTQLVGRLRELASFNASDDDISHQVLDQSAIQAFDLASRLEQETLGAIRVTQKIVTIQQSVSKEQADLIQVLHHMTPPEHYEQIVYFAEDRLGAALPEKAATSLQAPRSAEPSSMGLKLKGKKIITIR